MKLEWLVVDYRVRTDGRTDGHTDGRTYGQRDLSDEILFYIVKVEQGPEKFC